MDSRKCTAVRLYRNGQLLAEKLLPPGEKYYPTPNSPDGSITFYGVVYEKPWNVEVTPPAVEDK